MDFVPALAMVSLVITIVNLVKYARASDANGVLTTFTVWVAGVLATFLIAQTDFAAAFVVGDLPISEYNNWSLLFIGLTIGSMGAFANDLRKALDTSTSTRKPDLVGPGAHVDPE